MDVRNQDITERLKEILRAKVNDPFNRGSTSTETMTTGTSISLSNKELKCVDKITGVNSGDEYYRFKDFSVSFDDPSDSTDMPEVTFSSDPGEDVEIQYHYGSTFIYPTWPSGNISKAIITINHIGGDQAFGYLGDRKSSSTEATVNETFWQIDVWVEDGVNVTDPDPNTSGFFSGGKLCDYLSDQVTKIMEENKDHLKKQGINDVELTLERNQEYTNNIQSHRKTLNYTLTHEHQW